MGTTKGHFKKLTQSKEQVIVLMNSIQTNKKESDDKEKMIKKYTVEHYFFNCKYFMTL